VAFNGAKEFSLKIFRISEGQPHYQWILILVASLLKMTSLALFPIMYVLAIMTIKPGKDKVPAFDWGYSIFQIVTFSLLLFCVAVPLVTLAVRRTSKSTPAAVPVDAHTHTDPAGDGPGR
jgi:hypothetical protein